MICSHALQFKKENPLPGFILAHRNVAVVGENGEVDGCIHRYGRGRVGKGGN